MDSSSAKEIKSMKLCKLYMLLAGWGIRIGQNCDRGLELKMLPELARTVKFRVKFEFVPRKSSLSVVANHLKSEFPTVKCVADIDEIL